MPFVLAIRRMVREWRTMQVLLIAACFITGFMSVVPIYVRVVARAEFALTLEELDSDSLTAEFSNPSVIDDTVLNTLITEQFGDLTSTIRASAISDSYTSNREILIRVAAYRDFETYFVRGGTQTHSSTLPPENGVSAYITTMALEKLRALNQQRASSDIGQKFIIGDFETGTISLEIVDTVTPSIPESSDFWNIREDIFATLRPGEGPGFSDALSIGLIVSERDFIERITPVVGDVRHFREIQIAVEQISVDSINELVADLRLIEREMLRVHPLITLESKLFDLTNEYNASVRETERPVMLLAAIVAVIMLYNLATTLALILERQQVEWAMISSRGGSAFQITLIHTTTMFFICLTAGILGPLVAFVVVTLLTTLGPQREIISHVVISDLTPTIWIISLLTAAFVVTALVLPVRGVARQGILSLRHQTSRPPEKPAWNRLYLDIIAVALSIAFLIRMYLLNGGEEASIQSLIQNPRSWISALSTLESTSPLADPFNLAGIVLLITGSALLWIRLFPVFIRASGVLFSSGRSLSNRLAFWNIERNPGHYAQLVLLVIGTVALGVSSLILMDTRRESAWRTALQSTGTDAVLEFESSLLEEHPDWALNPDVNGYGTMMRYKINQRISNRSLVLIGFNADRIHDLPEIKGAFSSLLNTPSAAQSGLTLPDNTDALLLDVAIVQDSELSPLRLSVNALILNADYVLIQVPLTNTDDDATTNEEFATYQTTLDPQMLGPAPWHFTGLQMNGRRNEGALFEYTVYVDNLRIERASGETNTIANFEQNQLTNNWSRSESAERTRSILTLDSNSNFSSEGNQSLRILINQSLASTIAPEISFRSAQPIPMPVILSQAAVEEIKTGDTLETGDIERITFVIESNASRLPVSSLTLDIEVIGVLDNVVGTNPNDIVIATTESHLKTLLNQYMTVETAFKANTVYLNLNTREPDSTFVESTRNLPGFQSATYAWREFNALQRDPFANAITGILYMGFWISIILILIDFSFYIAITTQRRRQEYAVLQALGWEYRKLWRLILTEQAIFLFPALFIGAILGMLIAILVSPFMSLTTNQALQVPITQFVLLCTALVTAFAGILRLIANYVHRIKPADALRTVN